MSGRNNRKRRIAVALFAAVILAVFCMALKLFVIGAPVDGVYMNRTVSREGQMPELRVENNRDSAVAFRGWRFKRDGGTLSI